MVQYIQGLQLLLLSEERESLVLDRVAEDVLWPLDSPGSASDHDNCSELDFTNYQHLSFSAFQAGAGSQSAV